jgi:hypothetical protein
MRLGLSGWQAEPHRPAAVGSPFEHLAAFVHVVAAAAEQGQVVQVGGAVVAEPFVEVVA